MSKLLDLTGEKYGALTVITEAPASDRIRAWDCRCSCGQTLTVEQRKLRLGRVVACEPCSTKSCRVCAGPISASSSRVTCSEMCHRNFLREYQRQHKRSRPLSPAAELSRQANHQQRLRNDPEYAARTRDQKRKSQLLHQSERRELARQRHAERVANDPDYAESKRAARVAWSLMNPDAARAASRRYRERQRALKNSKLFAQTAEVLIEDMKK